MTSSKIVCIYSGGMDSFTMVHKAHKTGNLHSCLSFDYGQRHKKELQYAAAECARLGVGHYVIDLSVLTPHLLGSALTDAVAMPEGHYAEENMKLTVVPNRNMIMLSIAMAYAVSHKLDEVWYGAHAGDHTIYPDCREEFTDKMNAVAAIANWVPVQIHAPLQHDTKRTILQLGQDLGLTAKDYERTWTCYAGGEKACGRCGSCRERLEAFDEMGWVDPGPYEEA